MREGGGRRQLPWLSLAALLLLLFLVCASWRQRAGLLSHIEAQGLESARLREENQELRDRIVHEERRPPPVCAEPSAGGRQGPPAAAAEGEAEVNGTAVALLMKQWEDYYGLNAPLTAATPAWAAPEGAPAVRRAPHIQDCGRLDMERQEAESRGGNGSLPAWALPADPRPPWVVDGDGDNLPQTREAQAAIWRHQHPADCADPSLRFLIASWPRPPNHGLGSALHIMTLWLAAAMSTGRVLVAQPDFIRSQHEGCPGAALNPIPKCDDRSRREVLILEP